MKTNPALTTDHPALVGWGWLVEPARDGPAMCWYGWMAAAGIIAAIVGGIACLLPKPAAQPIAPGCPGRAAGCDRDLRLSLRGFFKE